MKSNSSLRAEARQALKGNWGGAALFTLVFYIIIMLLTGCSTIFHLFNDSGISESGVSFLSIILLLPISYSAEVAFLDLLHGQNLEIDMLFKGYKIRIWKTVLLQYLYTVLWTILLIIPGIIKSYSYAMTPYILKEVTTIQNNDAIERSIQMMKGHKMRLFLLDLSFLGWIILCMLTLGVGYFWLYPYIQSAHAAFYEDFKKCKHNNLF